jgi:hypothetical protein
MVLREAVFWEGQFRDTEVLKALEAWLGGYVLGGYVKEVSGGQVF